MIDIQYGIAIIGGREVSRPYRVWFFAEGECFLCFCFSASQYLSTVPKKVRDEIPLGGFFRGCLFQEGAEMLFGIDDVGAVIGHISK